MAERTTSPLSARRAVAEQRGRDLAAAWRRGERTIRTLAARHGVSRDTVYTDLRAQGIDPTDRTAPVEESAMSTLATDLDQVARAARAFDRDTEGFTMDIRLDTGAHRHLHFERGLDWWDLHTFPGGLMVRGGHHTFVFVNGADDIFTSFRWNAADPAYWAEKMTAGVARSWSEERFRAWLVQEAQERGVLDQAHEEVLDNDDEYNLEHEDSARWALANTHFELGIAFPTPDEVDLHDWDWHYLWTLRAIAAGIRTYDQSKEN